MVMLLNGGIGVTPMQSIAHQLMYEHEWGERDIKKLWFVWTARDPQVMSSMDITSNHHSPSSISNMIDASMMTKSQGSTNHYLEELSTVHKPRDDASAIFLAENGFAALPVSHSTDEELERDFPMDDFMDMEEEEVDEDDRVDDAKNDSFEDHPFEDLESGTGRPTSAMETLQGLTTDSYLVAGESANVDGVLELDCYLTANEVRDTGLSGLPFMNQGRPDMKRIFLEMREEAIKHGEKRVAICVCAPQRLVDITREACVKFSNRHVRFDFHSEVFD